MHESVVAPVLELWGAQAEMLPTSSDRSADWLAVLDGYRLLIEEKLKFEDPKIAAERGHAHAVGDVLGKSTALTHNNLLSGILRSAASQLKASAQTVPECDARLAWITCVGFGAEARFHQLLATLYGTTNIFSMGGPMRMCYFFGESEFFRLRGTLDGAVAAHLQDATVVMKLCLNPYSANWKSLKHSPLAAKLSAGTIDPVNEEAQGSAYIADCALDRSNPALILNFLEQKYGQSRLVNMHMTMISASCAAF